MKPLDFVLTKKGNIALVIETNREGDQASIRYIGKPKNRDGKLAWYDEDELEVIDNLPSLLARSTCHPMGRGEDDAEYFFGKAKKFDINKKRDND